ncbi:MAG: J domain-containing protein [Bacteroidales bacterium]|nr:J domain-containing protein [Bacteroidales bacterium]
MYLTVFWVLFGIQGEEMKSDDPKGYYQILELDKFATMIDIKAAFRKKAHKLHPDKNNKKDTTVDFQYLVHAYEVLSDPTKRAEYDILDIKKQNNTYEEMEPIKCSSCNKVTAQPRYVAFHQVRSFIFVSTVDYIQGIFCPSCAQKKVIKPTLITWILGWWSIWGIINTLHALSINLLGGLKPREQNANILAYQAWFFLKNNKLELAYSLANSAIKFSDDKKQISELKEMTEAIKIQNNNNPPKKIHNAWKVLSKAFVIQFSIIIIVIGTATSIYFIQENINKQERFRLEKIHKKEEIKKQKQKDHYNNTHPIQPLPENGTIFHKTNNNILAPFKIITKGTENYFIKLVDAHTNSTILEIFIRAGESFKTEVPIGTYKMKYATGSKWYGQKYLFGKYDTRYSKSDDELVFKVEGNHVLGRVIELFMQINGNFKTENIQAKDF